MSEAGSIKVNHKSITDSVTEILRRQILSRELAPGQRITQAELAAMVGVSTMPVREALLRLAAEGMVVAESNRSFSVANTTESGIRDIYWIHSVLAGELTARAWDHRTDAFVTELKNLNAAYKRAERSNQRDALHNTNWAFHALINRTAASPTLVLALKNSLHYFPDFSYDVSGWVELAGRWQTGLIKQFATGDREAARAVATTSITKAAELFISAYWRD
jgi:DNA-binding GntR family transcriptional regulator